MKQKLHELPDSWQWIPLSKLASKIGSGATPTGGQKSYKQQGISLIRSLNVYDHSFKKDGLAFIDNKQAKSLENVTVEKGDVLLNITGASIARCCLVPEEILPARVNQHVSIIRPLEIVESRYLEYILISPSMKTFLLNRGAGGATRQALTKKMLEKLKIPLPPLPEQRRIVAKLDALFGRIDAAIGLVEANIAAAGALWEAVLGEVFEGIKNISDEKIPLNKVAKVSRGKSKHRPRNDKRLFGDKIPFIQTGDIRQARKHVESFSQKYSDFGISQSMIWPKGSICLTIAANIGDVAILGMEACFPDSVVGIIPKNYDNEFLYYFLLTLKKELDQQANAAAQKNINLKILSQINVPLVSINRQKKIVGYLRANSEKAQQLKQLYQSKHAALHTLKASLLDRAFRGEL